MLGAYGYRRAVEGMRKSKKLDKPGRSERRRRHLPPRGDHKGRRYS